MVREQVLRTQKLWSGTIAGTGSDGNLIPLAMGCVCGLFLAERTSASVGWCVVSWLTLDFWAGGSVWMGVWLVVGCCSMCILFLFARDCEGVASLCCSLLFPCRWLLCPAGV